ncbi:5-oxoprolinase subunit PxpB [Endozoicomonas sp. SCSIO W0465]|uniref:5-oxoprolinase subunit PxpB n=1 Tax=Endozoicomonas sp. SCSIO W0465 TaxID=2918516 RepID=UPI002074D229|nr:5-oxoprolinase subunit PxpB [Endozoicomonas sp. SCSIO W0465]USE35676.1 5-oxoprolinase subunit PxpB [Endozoicomonas sp. SCSIO W0465]
MMDIRPVSETALIIQLGDHIDTQLAVKIGGLADHIRTRFASELIEVIPSYTTIYIQYHPLKTDFMALASRLQGLITAFFLSGDQGNSSPEVSKIITIPVYYSPETGPDLSEIAQLHNCTVQEVIQIHSQSTYIVCAIGFSPGFAFLGSVAPTIATPRKIEPRKMLPAGSVGIAGQQTAVYPTDSPGGWQIIGNCPVSLIDFARTPMSPFSVGLSVQFQPISRDEFFQLGGTLWSHWKS